MRNAKSRRGNRILASAVGAVGVMGLASVAYPAGTWDGGGADNSWQTANNWDDDTVPNFADYRVIAFGTGFASGDTLINNRTGNTYIKSMTFLAGTPALTITGTAGTGNKLYFASTPTLTNNSTANQIINANVILGNSLDVNGSPGSGTVTLGGIVSSTSTYYFQVNNNANVTITGTANSYTGETDAAAGSKLTIAGAGNINSTSVVNIINGGSFFYNSSTALTKQVKFYSGTGSTLGGSGTINYTAAATDVTSGNTLAPGPSGVSSSGTLTFSKDLTFKNGSKYAFDANDLTSVGGTLDLDDNWTLKLGSGFSNGGSVILFTYGTLASTPDLVPTFDTSGLGFTPSGSLSLTNDVTNKRIVLNGISVPEPTSAVALLAPGALMAIRRRKRS